MPSNTPLIAQPTKIKQIIIMPEMASAVICPDTGKSLKHSCFIKYVG
jgi:ADP-heptose:LPS heptosyltransferase